jgi:hypothetical protein
MKSFVPTEQRAACVAIPSGVLRKQFCPMWPHTATSCRAQCMHACTHLNYCAGAHLSGAARTRSCNKVFLDCSAHCESTACLAFALDVQLLCRPRELWAKPTLPERGAVQLPTHLSPERKTGASSDTGLAADRGAAEPSITIVAVGRSIEGFARAGTLTRAICSALDNCRLPIISDAS